MSSSSVPTPGPLTTIFTPPSDCFVQSLETTWSTCFTATSSIRCWYPQPKSCYATGAWIQEHSGQFILASAVNYSPGVLPFGFTGVQTSTDQITTVVEGCVSGWSHGPNNRCTSPTSGVYIIDSSTASGVFDALLPLVVVSWNAIDLTLFTPASAPVLPSATLAKYQSSVAASRSKSALASSTSTSTSTSGGSPQTTSYHSPNPVQTPGLSATAKIGIGVGVVIAAVFVIAIAFIFFRRRRRRTREEEEEEVQENGHVGNQRPYLDSKAELPSHNSNSNRRNQERAVPAELPDRSPSELVATRDSPLAPVQPAELQDRDPSELAATRDTPPRFHGRAAGGDTQELA